MINPNNAIDAYLHEHFGEFVAPTLFEDAPIIASNEIIMKDHILARILDYLSRTTIKGYQITVGDWLDHTLIDGGKEVDVRGNPKRYAELLFNQIFPEETYGSFTQWFDIEASVIDVSISQKIDKYRINSNWIIEILIEACETFKHKTDKETKNAWDRNLSLTGFDAVFPELKPAITRQW